MNKHVVTVSHVVVWSYTVELPDGNPFGQVDEARQIARARFDAGDRPEPSATKHVTRWEFAS